MAKKTPKTRKDPKAKAAPTAEMVSTKTLAERHGVSVQRVSQYARDGMPRVKRGGRWLYDPAVCLPWIAENYPGDAVNGGDRPGAGRPPKGGKRKSPKSKATPSPQPSPLKGEGAGVDPKKQPALDIDDEEAAEVAMWGDDEDRDPDPRAPYNELRRRNELEKLRLARIERMQKEGLLVDATEVRQEYMRKVSAAATHLRNTARVLSGDIASRFAVPSDRVHELTTLIDAKLHAVSLQLATQRYTPEKASKAGKGKGGDDAAG